MICPQCQTENLPGAVQCSHCSSVLSSVDVEDTLVGEADTSARMVSGRGRQGLAPGIELGTRYRVEKLLGRGGIGQGYKAYDRELGRVVALKVLRPEFAADATAKERFKQELLLASKVSQKNILRIHDLGEADGLKFISMAFVEGEDLHQVLERCGRLRLCFRLRTSKISRGQCDRHDPGRHNSGHAALYGAGTSGRRES